MDDIQIRLNTLEFKIDKILKHLEDPEKSSSNPYVFLRNTTRPPGPKGPPPGKKRPKTGKKKLKKTRKKSK